uniref:U6 snRNA-associated Sm-like protein LSm4 n=1 Tax=Auxenochlorella protothecoides TaxID=3075 RepID=A0A1D2A1K0_AUXPR
MQLIELKSGETYNGHLVLCDTWMNIHLREVICTSKDGDRFWRMPEAYVRGNTIKYLRVPDEVIDKAKEETLRRDEKRPSVGSRGRGRGPGRGGRDGGGGRGGRDGGGGRGGRDGGGGRGGRGAPNGGRGGGGGRGPPADLQ